MTASSTNPFKLKTLPLTHCNLGIKSESSANSLIAQPRGA